MSADNQSKLSSAPTKQTTSVSEFVFTPYEVKAGEKYMNPAMREHFKNILEMRQRALMEEVDSTLGHMKAEAADNCADLLDNAAQEERFTLELRTRDRERRLIKKIEKTLDLIESGDYGYCDSCGAEIGVRRLEARPTAEMCIDCKTIAEIREKQEGG